MVSYVNTMFSINVRVVFVQIRDFCLRVSVFFGFRFSHWFEEYGTKLQMLMSHIFLTNLSLVILKSKCFNPKMTVLGLFQVSLLLSIKCDQTTFK